MAKKTKEQERKGLQYFLFAKYQLAGNLAEYMGIVVGVTSVFSLFTKGLNNPHDNLYTAFLFAAGAAMYSAGKYVSSTADRLIQRIELSNDGLEQKFQDTEDKTTIQKN